MMKDRKAKAKLIILLGSIWIIVSLPLPWIINNPLVSESQFFTILGIIGIIVIILVVGIFYAAEQTRNKGFAFGNNLQSIQDDLKKLQTGFQAEMRILEEGDSTLDEFLEFSEKHVLEMQELVNRYDSLEPPEAFVSSLELFKFSTLSQMESDMELIQWIKTKDEGAKIRSDSLINDAFEYELAALEKYNAAKGGVDP